MSLWPPKYDTAADMTLYAYCIFPSDTLHPSTGAITRTQSWKTILYKTPVSHLVRLQMRYCVSSALKPESIYFPLLA